MKKLRLLGIFSVTIVSLFSPLNSLAAIVQNPGVDANGNVIIQNVPSGPGVTTIDIAFHTNNAVRVELDNLGVTSDDLRIGLTWNFTGTPWSELRFDFVDATLISVFQATPMTGVSSGTIYNPPLDLGTTQVLFPFDIVPESEGLISAFGPVSTPSGTYSLIITPTPVPIPATAWFFGSGLLAMIGIARRKKAA